MRKINGKDRLTSAVREKVRNRFSKATASAARIVLKNLNKSTFERDCLSRLPTSLQPAARAVYYKDWTHEERALAKKVEEYRERIRRMNVSLTSLPSPAPGSFETDSQGHSRGAPLVAASAERHAQTGVRPPGGLLLRRLVSGTNAKNVLELGTNTGFSGCYFLSAPHHPFLLTVEGSSELCATAQVNLSRFSDRFEIRNRFFDEVITELASAGHKFDCAFVDGQHEKEATLHYAARLRPLVNIGSMIVFDDIYWSHGMQEAWRRICTSSGYSLTLDLGWKGIAIVGEDEQLPTRYDICEYMGRPPISHTDR